MELLKQQIMNNIKYLIAGLLVAAITASCSSPVELRIMSFNVRYDNPEDSLDNWQYRKDVAAKAIIDWDADIVGTQEVLFNQLVDMRERLPDYNYIGVGREDGATQGEFSALFYKKVKFEETSSGYFWLAEDCDVVGARGWDAACERIATWAVLKDNKSGKELFVINTHLDHVGQVARRESVTLLVNKIKELSGGRPVVMTGDFNAEPDSDVIRHVTGDSEGMPLLNSRDHAQTIINDAPGTFHAFGRVPEDRREYIDYIFVSPGVKVRSYEVLPEKLDGIFVSDHTPIMVVIGIE